MGSIRKVTLDSYAVNPAAGTIEEAESIVLVQADGHWRSPAGAVKDAVVKALAGTLDGLKIVDARPKPAEMAADLRAGKMQISTEAAATLRPFGFLLTENGHILGSDGEMSVEMANGVIYQIRFGDVAATASDIGKDAGGDRYLFVTTSWDSGRAMLYGDTGGGEKVSRDLSARFADWFYVIGNADFQKLRLTKADVIQ